ncbi:hypothetical protein JB92DRAFT_2825468 [Gautieria morchelliformis]|nr:hypothetical protein JB92DRAFT_2825468 [Gautieria morchelliformis]
MLPCDHHRIESANNPVLSAPLGIHRSSPGGITLLGTKSKSIPRFHCPGIWNHKLWRAIVNRTRRRAATTALQFQSPQSPYVHEITTNRLQGGCNVEIHQHRSLPESDPPKSSLLYSTALESGTTRRNATALQFQSPQSPYVHEMTTSRFQEECKFEIHQHQSLPESDPPPPT